jgi:hypothetical protein
MSLPPCYGLYIGADQCDICDDALNCRNTDKRIVRHIRRTRKDDYNKRRYIKVRA